LTVYYDFGKNGLLKKVPEGHKETVGLKYISEQKAYELSDGKYKQSGWLYSDNVTPPMHYASTDSMGVQGVLNPADGKRYDSRAAYYRAVKEKGLVIVGDDAPKEPLKPKTKEINWKKAVAETLKTTTLKGKRK